MLRLDLSCSALCSWGKMERTSPGWGHSPDTESQEPCKKEINTVSNTRLILNLSLSSVFSSTFGWYLFLLRLKNPPRPSTQRGELEFHSFADAVCQAQISLGTSHWAEISGYFQEGACFGCFNQRDYTLAVHCHPLTAGHTPSRAGKGHRLKHLATEETLFAHLFKISLQTPQSDNSLRENSLSAPANKGWRSSYGDIIGGPRAALHFW